MLARGLTNLKDALPALPHVVMWSVLPLETSVVVCVALEELPEVTCMTSAPDVSTAN